jgi:non-specific serine/threonine protein kinase
LGTKNQNKKDAYACIQWALENREKLESLGFSLENLKIDGKKY